MYPITSMNPHKSVEDLEFMFMNSYEDKVRKEIRVGIGEWFLQQLNYGNEFMTGNRISKKKTVLHQFNLFGACLAVNKKLQRTVSEMSEILLLEDNGNLKSLESLGNVVYTDLSQDLYPIGHFGLHDHWSVYEEPIGIENFEEIMKRKKSLGKFKPTSKNMRSVRRSAFALMDSYFNEEAKLLPGFVLASRTLHLIEEQ